MVLAGGYAMALHRLALVIIFLRIKMWVLIETIPLSATTYDFVEM